MKTCLTSAQFKEGHIGTFWKDNFGHVWGARNSRHVGDSGYLAVLKAEGVGGDDDIGSWTPAPLHVLRGNNEALNAALKEFELEIVVVNVSVRGLVIAIALNLHLPLVPIGLCELAPGLGVGVRVVVDDKVVGALRFQNESESRGTKGESLNIL